LVQELELVQAPELEPCLELGQELEPEKGRATKLAQDL